MSALHGLGEVYFGIGKSSESVAAFEEAIALAKEVQLPPRQLVRLYHWISAALWFLSRYDEVIRYGKMGLEILGDDTECLEAALMNEVIGRAKLNKGNRAEGRKYIRQNMGFIKTLPYSEQLINAYGLIIELVDSQDRDLEAKCEWMKELETRAEEHNDLRGVAFAWFYQGNLAWRLGNYKDGLSLLTNSLDMFRRVGDDKCAIWCYMQMSYILFNSGDIEEAKTHKQLSLKLMEQIGHPRDIALAHGGLGDIAMCQRRFKEAIFHYQKSLEEFQAIEHSRIVLAHHRLGRAYLKKGKPHRALQSFETVSDIAIAVWDETVQYSEFAFFGALVGVEEAYMALGTPEKFVEFCRSFKEQHSDAVEKLSLHQWYLESAEPSTEFTQLDFADDFETETIEPSWSWIDEFGDCKYRIVNAGGLEICAANGRDLYGLTLNAPRLMRKMSKDFAVEVCMSQACDEKPQMGGLLVWKDRDNFLRFEKGVHGQDEVRLHGYVDGKYQVAGRGLLCRCSASVPARDEGIHLRLEREGEPKDEVVGERSSFPLIAV